MSAADGEQTTSTTGGRREAGWYPEEATGLIRYHDGDRWTDRRRAASNGEPDEPRIPAGTLPITMLPDAPRAPRPRPATRRPQPPRRASSTFNRVFYLCSAVVFCLGLLVTWRVRDPQFRLQCAASQAGFGTLSFPDNFICSLIH